MSDKDPLLADIEAALDLYKVSPSRFGYYAVGDPALVPRMRAGMVLKPRRRERVAKALAKIHEDKGVEL